MELKKRKSLILHFDSLDIIDELNKEQIADLFIAIRDYNLWKDIKLEWLMKAVFIPLKNQFDRDIEKYVKKCEVNAINWSKWGRPKETQDNPVGLIGKSNNPNKAYNKNDSNNKSNNNSITVKPKVFTEESFEYIISKRFLDYHLEDQTPSILYIVTNKWKYEILNKWADEIRKLKDIDNYSETQIKYIIDFTLQDDFWKNQILSIEKFRKKKDGVTYFVKMIDKAKENSNNIKSAKPQNLKSEF